MEGMEARWGGQMQQLSVEGDLQVDQELPAALEELMERGTADDLLMVGGIPEIQDRQVVEVAIDWMSCTQSLRKTVQQYSELCYIPLDKQEWVFSQAMEGWVQNIPVDLETTTCEEIWEKGEVAAREKTRRHHAEVRGSMLGM